MSPVPGTHFEGPLLGSGRSLQGLFEDVPVGFIDRARSPYKVYYEGFDYLIASAATFAGSGATLTDLNTATSPTNAVTGADPFLLINPGTKADAGSSIQWNAAVSQATYITPAQRFLPVTTSTATLMDGREMFMFWRFGVQCTTAAWDGKVLMGWFATDTSPMDTGTGQPTVGTGCGLGFHIGEGGVMTFIGQQTAITTANTSNTVGVTVGSGNYALTAATWQWHEVGFRWRCIDASAGTGTAKFYHNGRKVGEITSDLPMASTETYSVTMAIANGPALVADLALAEVVMGITKPGLTYPYTSGLYF